MYDTDQHRKAETSEAKHRKLALLALGVVLILCIPSFALISRGKDKDYTLTLTVKSRYSTISLTSCLTENEGHNRKEPIVNATIHFYTCDSCGRHMAEIGQNQTKRDGKATFQWSAPGNGKYWFIAAYIANAKTAHELTVTS